MGPITLFSGPSLSTHLIERLDIFRFLQGVWDPWSVDEERQYATGRGEVAWI
jgi:hypothetical protein